MAELTAAADPLAGTDVAALLTFLTARMNEAEAAARAASFQQMPWGEYIGVYLPSQGELREYADRCDPAHALADLAAKRLIINAFREQQEFRVLRGLRPSLTSRVAGLEYAALALAAPFANHPDYNPAWALGDER